MGRRKSQTPSSLELFLDTICNTFGGIVFLAILLSVIVQNRTKDPTQTPHASSVTAEEAEMLALRSQHLMDRLSQLSQLVKELQPLQPTNDDHRVDAVATTLNETQKKLAAELDLQNKLAAQISEQAEKNFKLAEAQEKLLKQAEQAQKRLSEEKDRLKRQLDERMQILALPRVRAVAKPTAVLFMRFGKVYRFLINKRDLDKDHLIVSENTATKHVVEPRRESGWNLNDVGNRLMLTQHLNAFPASSYAIHIFVWPDSFEQFGDLKRLLLEQDYQYDLETYSNGDSITLVVSDRTPMVQ